MQRAVEEMDMAYELYNSRKTKRTEKKNTNMFLLLNLFFAPLPLFFKSIIILILLSFSLSIKNVLKF